VLTPDDLATAAQIGVSGDALQAWVETFAAAELVFSHGDLLLTNVMATGAAVTLLDWEYAGLRLPGYDHALLWLALMDHPAAQDLVATRAAAQSAFRLHAATLLLRELRIHRQAASAGPGTAHGQRRLRRGRPPGLDEHRPRGPQPVDDVRL